MRPRALTDAAGLVPRAPRRTLEVLGHLGAGTFGQVLKVRSTSSGHVFALKVIRNRHAFRRQAQTEIELLRRLRVPSRKIADAAASSQGGAKTTSDARALVVQLHEHFLFKNHLCLVFEPLGVNLLQLLQQNQCIGLSTSLIRYFCKQLLQVGQAAPLGHPQHRRSSGRLTTRASGCFHGRRRCSQVLALLGDLHICHCDLKPENILLQNLHSPAIKLIDFGSACYADRTLHTYVQSRFYRSPEVLLGCPYGTPIDIWSLGAIVGELFLGLPLFPGESEYNQVSRTQPRART